MRESGSADGAANDKMSLLDLGAVSDADLTRVNSAVENGMADSPQLLETDTLTLPIR